jgi:hypothetical protein
LGVEPEDLFVGGVVSGAGEAEDQTHA